PADLPLFPYTTLFRSLRDPAEVGDDPRKRGRDDRLVERGEQERDHEPDVDRERPPERVRVAGGVLERRSASVTPSPRPAPACARDRKSTRLNSSHLGISYAVFCLKKKNLILGSVRSCAGTNHVALTRSQAPHRTT